MFVGFIVDVPYGKRFRAIGFVFSRFAQDAWHQATTVALDCKRSGGTCVAKERRDSQFTLRNRNRIMKRRLLDAALIVGTVAFLTQNAFAQFDVPDAGSTSLMLGGVLAGLAVGRRFLKR